jgi:hypothetical protein
VTVTGISAAGKVYDATTAASLVGTASVSAIGGDSVAVLGAGHGEFASSEVGAKRDVVVTGFSLGGVDAGNYRALQPIGLSASILADQNLDTPSIPGLTAIDPPRVVSTSAALPVRASKIEFVDAAGAPRPFGQTDMAIEFSPADANLAMTVSNVRGSAFTLAIVEQLTKLGDNSSKLRFDARTELGGDLPNWLKFDADSMVFSGIVPAGIQSFNVRLVGQSGSGSPVSIAVNLTFGGAQAAL